MQAIIRFLLSGLPLMAMPAMAAQGEMVTGITGVGPAMFAFTLALALLLTLVLRSTVSHATAYFAARAGRIRVRRALGKRSKDLLSDFILPGAYGGLARIDYAMLTAGGILCIRTVHRRGVVFGGESEAQWTNVDGAERRRFLNPLIQNEGRARALRNVVAGIPVANLVIFTGAVEFSSPPPANVIRLRDLDSFIAKFVVGPSKIDDWDAVWLSVQAAAMTDTSTRKDFEAQIGFS